MPPTHTHYTNHSKDGQEIKGPFHVEHQMDLPHCTNKVGLKREPSTLLPSVRVVFVGNSQTHLVHKCTKEGPCPMQYFDTIWRGLPPISMKEFRCWSGRCIANAPTPTKLAVWRSQAPPSPPQEDLAVPHQAPRDAIQECRIRS